MYRHYDGVWSSLDVFLKDTKHLYGQVTVGKSVMSVFFIEVLLQFTNITDGENQYDETKIKFFVEIA